MYIEDFVKVTGIKKSNLKDYTVDQIIKEPDLLTTITKVQYEKVMALKNLFNMNSEDSNNQKINSSKDAYKHFEFLKNEIVEKIYILLLKRNNSVIKKIELFSGGLNSSVVDIRLIAKKCLNNTANSCILVHNHPSGNIQPSNVDRQITKKIKEGLEILDIDVLDHLIIGGNKYLSFTDEGIL